MRKARIVDRCFVILVLLALLGFFAGVVYALVDEDPRPSGMMLLFQTRR